MLSFFELLTLYCDGQGELEPAADLGAEADAAGGRGPEEEEGDHRGRGGSGMAVGRCPVAEFSAA